MVVSWELMAKIAAGVLALVVLASIVANKETRDKLGVVGINFLEAWLERWIRHLGEPAQTRLAEQRSARLDAHTVRVMAQIRAERAARSREP
jgi:hypothetical protein